MKTTKRCMLWIPSTLLLLVISCEGGKSVESMEQMGQNHESPREVVNFKNLPGSEASLIKGTYAKFLQQNGKSDLFETPDAYDFENAAAIPTDEAIEIIVVEKYKNLGSAKMALFGFCRDGAFLPYFVINRIKKVNDHHFKVDLFKISGATIFKCTIKDNKIILDDGSIPSSSADNGGGIQVEAKSAFGSCVSKWLNFFGNGSTEGSISGVGCMAFGAYCAAAITGNCLAKQVESWF